MAKRTKAQRRAAALASWARRRAAAKLDAAGIPKLDATQTLLQERGTTHGPFEVNSRVSQSLKNVLRVEPGYAQLNSQQAEALDMIVHKIGRIVAGNPNFNDHWDDIAGYAKLCSK